MTTKRLYAGVYKIEIQINGKGYCNGEFCINGMTDEKGQLI
ncbi:hypothetical protein [Clostridium sp. 'deep sea']|nr:hypothetical protein [Clostridium sp. 'deep sea']